MCSEPSDLRSDQSAAFVASALASRPRVLEVGCRRGDVSRRLAHAGFSVTAIDAKLRAPSAAPGVTFIECDLFAFEAEPFDAIVYSDSLHAFDRIGEAMQKTLSLLKPTGRLIVEDFDVEAPDLGTLRWYYDAQELLCAAGMFPRDRIDPVVVGNDHLARWRANHLFDSAFLAGSAMRFAISSRFVIRELKRVEYLYRLIGLGLPTDARGTAIVQQLRVSERRGIEDGSLTPVGLRIVADRASIG